MPISIVAPAATLTFWLMVPKEDCWKRKREEEHLFTTWREAALVKARRVAKKAVDLYMVVGTEGWWWWWWIGGELADAEE
jgi:hypothetical protein